MAGLLSDWSLFVEANEEIVAHALFVVTWFSMTLTVHKVITSLKAFRLSNPGRAHSAVEALIVYVFSGYGGGIFTGWVLGEAPMFLAAGNWLTFFCGALAVTIVRQLPDSAIDASIFLSAHPCVSLLLTTCSCIIDGLCLLGGVDRALSEAAHSYARSLPNAVLCGTMAAKAGGIVVAACNLAGEWGLRRVPQLQPLKAALAESPAAAADWVLFHTTALLAAAYTGAVYALADAPRGAALLSLIRPVVVVVFVGLHLTLPTVVEALLPPVPASTLTVMSVPVSAAAATALAEKSTGAPAAGAASKRRRSSVAKAVVTAEESDNESESSKAPEPRRRRSTRSG
jgi:hypothetical protein